MISIGNLQINKLCLGDVEVTKAYLGDVQVYGSSSPTPPTPTVDPVNFIPKEFDGRAVFYNDLTGEYINLGSDWSFGEDVYGAYVTNNGNSGMYSLGIIPDEKCWYDIKFMYSNPDGRQFFGNSSEYDDSENTFRFFFNDFMTFDLGANGERNRIGVSTENYVNQYLNIRLGNYYMVDMTTEKKLDTSDLAGSSEKKASYPNLDYLYVGTDAESNAATFKIYGISVVPFGYEQKDQRNIPLTFTSTVDGNALNVTKAIWGTAFSNFRPGVVNPPNLEYSVNDGEWQTYNGFDFAYKIELNAGDFVRFRGVNPNGFNFHTVSTGDLTEPYKKSAYTFTPRDSEGFEISGNIMSIIDGIGKTDTVPEYAFVHLLSNFIKTKTFPCLYGKYLGEGCYQEMLFGCEKINRLECYAENIGSYALSDWMYMGYEERKVGVFYKKRGVTFPNDRWGGIPSTWEVIEVD